MNEPFEISMVRAFLVVLALLGATSSAIAGATSSPNSGAAVIEACEQAARSTAWVDRLIFDAGFCMGIVAATMWSLRGTNLLCFPKGVTTGNCLRVLIKYMDDHPEELHMHAADLDVRAFVKAWPCSHDSEKPADESFPKR
jgi:hypothetical protein